jgi:hypothetical protein
MNKYYFITYVTRRLGKQLFDSCVADEHPFDWLRRTQAEHNFQTILAGWQEISENEYNKYDKGMTKYDPIQTGARLASPRGLQDLDHQKPR